VLVLAGGVAANSHLRRALQELCDQHKVTLAVPPISLCGDNGAMVAAAGYFAFMNGERAGTDLNASAYD
jgi:N6-L-threonylcarbamoyladenine synthase